MHITKEELKGHTVLRCEGRLDAITAAQLEDELTQLIDSNKVMIMIDFAGIDYLSSAGMRLLLSATKRVKNKKGKMSIFSIHEEVREIINMAGFEKVLAIYNSEEEAHKSYDEKMTG